MRGRTVAAPGIVRTRNRAARKGSAGLDALRRWFMRSAGRRTGLGGSSAGRWQYGAAAALLAGVAAVIAVVAAVSGAGSGGGPRRAAVPSPGAGRAASPLAATPPGPDTATPATTESAAGVTLIAGFPGAIPVASATPPAAPFPTPPTLPGMPVALAPGQATPSPPGPPPPPPAVPATAGAPPPPNPPPGLATPPPPNPPPSGIPTPPVAVPPPAVVNPAPAAAPVVQSVVNAPPAIEPPSEPAAQAAGTMLLSVAVRAADRPDALVSPSVRVFANGEECAEGTGVGAILVQVAVPDSCAQPGDLLSFEAGGLDSRAAAPSEPAPACPVELLFDATSQPFPAYQPVEFAAGPRFVTLDLADLPDCPAPGAAAVPASADETTLTLTVLQRDTPGAPLERPTVTAFVGPVPCARNTALAGQQVVLTLPAACGQPGAAVILRASALDVRYQRGGDAPACPIVPPPAGVSVPDFQPQPQPIGLQPGAVLTAALLLDGCPAGTLTAASAPATPSATATASAAPSPAPSPAPVTTPGGAGTATAAVATSTGASATPAADPTSTSVATVSPAPTSSPVPTATPPPALSVSSAVPGGITVFATPSPR
jgi:hypothetical protein